MRTETELETQQRAFNVAAHSGDIEAAETALQAIQQTFSDLELSGKSDTMTEARQALQQALNNAVGSGHADSMQIALAAVKEAGGGINDADASGMTPAYSLKFMSPNRDTDASQAFLEENGTDFEAAERLVKLQKNLIFASSAGNKEAIDAALAAGAQKDLPNYPHRMVATQSTISFGMEPKEGTDAMSPAQTIEYLHSLGFDLNAGEVPAFHLAVDKASMDLEMGVPIEKATKIMDFLATHGADVTAQTRDSSATALGHTRNTEIAEKVLSYLPEEEHAAFVNAAAPAGTKHPGKTELHEVASGSQERDRVYAQWLLDHGANVNARIDPHPGVVNGDIVTVSETPLDMANAVKKNADYMEGMKTLLTDAGGKTGVEMDALALSPAGITEVATTAQERAQDTGPERFIKNVRPGGRE